MIDQMIRQLNDPDPQRRREAIVALGRSKDFSAMPHLSRVYREDPDPELRELARKAGQYIRQSNPDVGAATQSLPGRSSSAVRLIGDVRDETAAAAGGMAGIGDALGGGEAASQEPQRKGPTRGRTYNVPPEKVKSARSFTEGALDAQIRGENDKAMKNLATALSLNPNLVNDSYYMNIAASVTNLEGDGAIQMIVDSDQRKTYIKEQVKQKKKAKVDSHMTVARESTWGSVIFEVIGYLLINIVGPVLLTLVAAESARNAFGGLDTRQLSPAEAAALRDFRASIPLAGGLIGGASIGVLAIAGVIGGTLGVIGFFIQGLFIHLFAKLFGGRGTFAHMATSLLRFLNRFLLVLFVLLGVLIVVTFVTLGSPLIFCIAIPLVLYQFYFLFKYVGVVGEAYDFGTGLGCLTVLLASVTIAVISGAITALAGRTLLEALLPLLPAEFQDFTAIIGARRVI